MIQINYIIKTNATKINYPSLQSVLDTVAKEFLFTNTDATAASLGFYAGTVQGSNTTSLPVRESKTNAKKTVKKVVKKATKKAAGQPRQKDGKFAPKKAVKKVIKKTTKKS